MSDKRKRGLPGVAGPTIEMSHLNNKRVRTRIINGEQCHFIKWTDACSGCTETPECTASPERGLGCPECGYTGKRRTRMWFPVNPMAPGEVVS